jgi:hypothetical protein
VWKEYQGTKYSSQEVDTQSCKRLTVLNRSTPVHHQPEKGITKRREGGKSMQGILQMISALNTNAHIHCQRKLSGVTGKEREGQVVGNSTGGWKRAVICNIVEHVHHQLKEG